MLTKTGCIIRIDQCLVEPSTHAVVTYLLLDESFASFFLADPPRHTSVLF